jgi:uncharacterized phage protein (TIGR02218 family)
VKTIPVALATHYAGKARSVALFLKITRGDGEVFGWNSTDIPLEVDSVTYEPGLELTSISLAAGLGVNNLELTVLPDEEGGTITRADLLTGLWDGSSFELFEANYRSLGDGTNPLLSGINGDVTVNRGSFVVEMRGLTQFLNQPIGIVTSKTCRYLFGVNNGLTSLCPVDLEPLTLEHTVTSAASRQVFTASGAVQAADYYGEGTVEFLTGENAGRSRRVKAFAAGVFTVDLPFPYEIAATDTFTAVKGCRKRLEDCIANGAVLDFGGEPHGRGIDVITATPEPDE